MSEVLDTPLLDYDAVDGYVIDVRLEYGLGPTYAVVSVNAGDVQQLFRLRKEDCTALRQALVRAEEIM